MWGWREREQTKREWVKKKQPKFNTRERNCITKWQKNNNNNTTTSEMHSFRIWMNFCISAARLLDRFGCCSKYSHTTKTTTKEELEILQSNEIKTYNTSQNVNQMQNILINLSTITTPPDLYLCFSFFFSRLSMSHHRPSCAYHFSTVWQVNCRTKLLMMPIQY